MVLLENNLQYISTAMENCVVELASSTSLQMGVARLWVRYVTAS